jgi:hypothetical protein
VTRSASTYWLEQGPRCYQAFPYHWLIHPAEGELTEFLRRHRALSARYSTSLEAPEGRMSYHIVLEKPDYGLDDLGKWARKNVRRGLKSCAVEPIGFDRLDSEGWGLHEDTLDRQGRSEALTREDWRAMCAAAADLPGFQAWGAMVEGRLAASVITFQLDECCYMLYQQCRREYLPAHVNNALSFTVTQAMAAREGTRSVLYSLHSLDASPTMDQFKLRMGYTAKPVRQRVVFHPWCAPLVGPVTYAILKKLAALRPSSRVLAKGEGMARFFLEGRQPLENQSIPAALQSAGEEATPDPQQASHAAN